MRTVALDFPKSILIESCSLCQGNCIFCPYQNIRKGQKADYLDEAIIIRLLKEIKNYDVKRISLFNNNEPLLDSRIYELVKQTRIILPNVEITLSTNGFLLNEDVINKLYENGLTAFYISIPTLNEEDYKQIMGYELNKVLAPIRKFYNTAQAAMLRIAVPKARSYDEKAFKNEFRSNGIKVAPWNIENVASWHLDKAKINNYFELGIPTDYCDRPMDQAVILANGNMVICCRDWHEEEVLGNVKVNTIYEIWHNEKCKRIQRLIGGYNYKEIPICKGCTMNLEKAEPMKKIIWGTCWFNESVETIIEFFEKTKNSLSKMNLKYSFVIFDAMYHRDIAESNIIKGKFNCNIIQNTQPFFPNKNYGVYAIVNLAKINNADYVTVVDPDWQITDYQDFVKSFLFPLIYDNKEIVIPNIESSAGRSNYMLGVPMITLFYPEAQPIIKTPFPGTFAAITDKMQKIITADNYHFDWGGEWDIVAEAVKLNLQISSPQLGLIGTRHRSSYSKTSDAFQIWRALFQGVDQVKITTLINSNNEIDLPDNYQYLKEILSGSASQQIQKFIKYCENNEVSATVAQLYNMILLPLALILDGTDYSNIKALSKFDNLNPYIKKEISHIVAVVIYSVNEALKNSELTIPEIKKRLIDLSGGFMGDWNSSATAKAKAEIIEQIEGVVIRWN